MSWAEAGSCYGRYELTEPRRLGELEALCGDCAVRAECATEALRFVEQQKSEYAAVMAERARLAETNRNKNDLGRELPLVPTSPALYGVWGGVRVTVGTSGNPVFVGTKLWPVIERRLKEVARGEA